MKRRIKKKNDESEINITPMLDIVFIMLIFFIVTTSFVKEISIDVNRPTKSPIKEQKKSDVISVRILDSGQILIQEINEIFEQSSSYVNNRHISLLADVMTNKGILMSIDIVVINGTRKDILKCLVLLIKSTKQKIH